MKTIGVIFLMSVLSTAATAQVMEGGSYVVTSPTAGYGGGGIDSTVEGDGLVAVMYTTKWGYNWCTYDGLNGCYNIWDGDLIVGYMEVQPLGFGFYSCTLRDATTDAVVAIQQWQPD
jgi:hypothetical protein